MASGKEKAQDNTTKEKAQDNCNEVNGLSAMREHLVSHLAETMGSCADKEERIKGVYDVWQRLGVVHHAHGPEKNSWNSASCEEMIALVKQELGLTELLKSKLALCIEAHELDGEVMGTFATPHELCEHTGLQLISDLSSYATGTHAAERILDLGFSNWGQTLADAAASRRLFARTRSCAPPGCSVEEVQGFFETIITTHMHGLLSSCSPDAASKKAAQIEALVAARVAAATAAMNGIDLSLLAPAEASCLIPPWLRSGRDDVVSELVSLVIQMRRMPAIDAMPLPVLHRLPPAVAQTTTIVVLGNTGAGKSTLLNAFLDEVALLPTNAMRACTASIIEMEFNACASTGAEYTARVDFSSSAEWEMEVREAYHLVQQAQPPNADAGAIKAPDEETVAHEAWCKLRAAYGTEIDWTSADAVLSAVDVCQDQDAATAKHRIQQSLGTTIEVKASSGAQLCELYSKCVDSVNDGTHGSLWPVVKRVLLRGPWPILSHGVRLVDAPGLADDNSARDAVVKKILEQANAVWLVSNIRRAVNDKTVKDMMPPNFRQVLVEHGVLGSLVFIATHTDVIIRSEVIENLKDLAADASIEECSHARNDFFRNKIVSDFNRSLDLDQGAGDLDRAAVRITGLVGAADVLNGVYEPTGTSYNGKVLFRKRNDPDRWLRFNKQRRWAISNTQDKDEDACAVLGIPRWGLSEWCYSCVSLNKPDIEHPAQVDKWMVLESIPNVQNLIGKEQRGIKCSVEPLEPPFLLMSQLLSSTVNLATEHRILLDKLRACLLENTCITQQQREVIVHHLCLQYKQHAKRMQHLTSTRRQKGAGFELATFAVSAVDYQKLAGLRKNDGMASVFKRIEETQVPGLRNFVRATAGLQRLSAFKAGAELVRCLQEAKVAAREEEEMMLEKPPEHHKQANIQGVPPEISDAVCRYCREQIGHDAYVSCANGAVFRAPLPPATTFVHRGCFEEAKTLINPGAEVRVDLPGDKFHGKVVKVFTRWIDKFGDNVQLLSGHRCRTWFVVPVKNGTNEPIISEKARQKREESERKQREWQKAEESEKEERLCAKDRQRLMDLQQEQLTLVQKILQLESKSDVPRTLLPMDVETEDNGQLTKVAKKAAMHATSAPAQLSQHQWQPPGITDTASTAAGASATGSKEEGGSRVETDKGAGASTAASGKDAGSGTTVAVIDLTDSPPATPRRSRSTFRSSLSSKRSAKRPKPASQLCSSGGGAGGNIISLCSSDEES